MVFDPQKVTYETLLKTFWENHNPDPGHAAGQRRRHAVPLGHLLLRRGAAGAAERRATPTRQELTRAATAAITTEIVAAPEFYYAEDYHQQYLAKNPDGYCGLGGTGVSCPVGVRPARRSDLRAVRRLARRCGVGSTCRRRGLGTDLKPSRFRSMLCYSVTRLGLNALDYAVVALYLVAVTGFGTYFARFQKTTGDYFLTGRSVPWWAICFTIVATETSTLTFIGVPAAAYAGNMTFLQLAVGYVIGRLLVSMLFIPAYFRGDLVTSYELLQRRFGSGVKTVAAGLFLITRSLADGIRLFATALVIAIVTGVPVPVTIVTLGVAMMIYTERGGVAAVIWTDVVQMFIYVAGALVVFAALLWNIPGGWAEVVRLGAPAGKFTVIDLSLDPTAHLHVVGRSGRRRRADAGDARDRPVPGAAAAVGAARSARRSAASC